MSEKTYRLLLRLYPVHFRRAYGDEALRLVLDRARDEKGFCSGLRLWLDLLTDLAVSLPREYVRAPAKRMLATTPVSSEPMFQLLAERSVSPTLLLLCSALSAVLLWTCVTVIARTRPFPPAFADPHSLQALVQTDLALAASSSANSAPADLYRFCMKARHNIPNSSVKPLIAVGFAPPGASGAVLIDGKIVQVFKNEQHLAVRAEVVAGDHQFVLNLDKPVGNISMSRNDELQYCSPE